MAVIAALPALEIIRGMRGCLDYYYHRGLYCVRTWPRSPSGPRSLPSQATASTFASYSRRLSASPASLVLSARAAASGSTWTWKDITTRAAYGHLVDW